MPTVRRFWIEFDPDHGSILWWGRYTGVTGFDERDCLSMVADLLSDGDDLPPRRPSFTRAGGPARLTSEVVWMF
ncbi:hypothetical protein [Nocardia sp. CA-290969]|uniref:hypothetical protein n=1 Tax=Nocardia sp. CA-290969 TaxID=3239986 RepID=UPI003D8C0283